MEHLRNLSARPDLVVDPAGRLVGDVSGVSGSQVGLRGPFGRERIVTALPTNKSGGPVKLAAPVVVHDADSAHLADPDGNLIGTPAVIVHRFLAARWTGDTRRLAG